MTTGRASDKAGAVTPNVGDEVSVAGHEGRFRVMRLPADTADGSVMCWGPVTGRAMKRARTRSFSPDRITKVHKTKKEHP